MLVTLGKLVGHTTLPEAFYNDYTFEDASPEERLSPEREEEYSIEIAERLKEAKVEITAHVQKSVDNPDEGEEDDEE
jgi:hypothetical protein